MRRGIVTFGVGSVWGLVVIAGFNAAAVTTRRHEHGGRRIERLAGCLGHGLTVRRGGHCQETAAQIGGKAQQCDHHQPAEHRMSWRFECRGLAGHSAGEDVHAVGHVCLKISVWGGDSRQASRVYIGQSVGSL